MMLCMRGPNCGICSIVRCAPGVVGSRSRPSRRLVGSESTTWVSGFTSSVFVLAAPIRRTAARILNNHAPPFFEGLPRGSRDDPEQTTGASTAAARTGTPTSCSSNSRRSTTGGRRWSSAVKRVHRALPPHAPGRTSQSEGADDLVRADRGVQRLPRSLQQERDPEPRRRKTSTKCEVKTAA